MTDRIGDVTLLEEPGAEIRVDRERGVKDLDRDRVPVAVRPPVDGRHAPHAEQRVESVLPAERPADALLRMGTPVDHRPRRVPPLETGVESRREDMDDRDGVRRRTCPADCLSRRLARGGSVRDMARVTGIGGVFFKTRGDKEALQRWYAKHLGIALEPWGGAILKWPDDTASDKGLTVWHVAAKDSDWFAPSDAPFMINYRVDDLDGLIVQLETGGVAIHKGPEQHENGKFAWVLDPDGNKVELWEPS